MLFHPVLEYVIHVFSAPAVRSTLTGNVVMVFLTSKWQTKISNMTLNPNLSINIRYPGSNLSKV